MPHPERAPKPATRFQVGERVIFRGASGVVTAKASGWNVVRFDDGKKHACCPHFSDRELTPT